MMAVSLPKQRIKQRQKQENKVEVSRSNHLQDEIQNKRRVKTRPIPKVLVELGKI